MREKLYIDLWARHRESIKEALKKAEDKPSIQLRGQEFEDAGNRGSGYQFNLEFKDGKVVKNMRGNAVSRDLRKILLDSDEIEEILKSGHFKINMDKKFYLKISRED